jgi:hypothetical protein
MAIPDGGESSIDGDATMQPARYLTQLWKAKRPKLRAVAARAGCSTAFVSEVLAGKKVPSDEVGDRILAGLGGQPDQVWHQMLTDARRARKASRKTGSAELAISDSNQQQQPKDQVNPQRRASSPVSLGPQRERRNPHAAVFLLDAAMLMAVVIAGLVTNIAKDQHTATVATSPALLLPGAVPPQLPPQTASSNGTAPAASPTAPASRPEKICHWEVVWSTAGVYAQPSRDQAHLVKRKHRGDSVGPYCTTYYNAGENETYIMVQATDTADGIGWMRQKALKPA